MYYIQLIRLARTRAARHTLVGVAAAAAPVQPPGPRRRGVGHQDLLGRGFQCGEPLEKSYASIALGT